MSAYLRVAGYSGLSLIICLVCEWWTPPAEPVRAIILDVGVALIVAIGMLAQIISERKP